MPYKNIPFKYRGANKLHCRQCGDIYFRPTLAVEKSKYCSNSCKNLNAPKKENHPMWNGGAVDVNCKLCGVNFKKEPRFLKKSKYVFCSCRCRTIFYKSKQKTKNTDIENITEEILLKNKKQYEKQKILGKICIADFFLPRENIAIFCDGDYWHNFPFGKPRDSVQIEQLNLIGIKGVRFWGSEIIKKDFEVKLLELISRI